MRSIQLKRFLAALFAVSCALPSASHAAPHLLSSDINGDGVSELTLVTIESDHSLTWKSYDASTGQLVRQTSSVGALGNNLIFGNWVSTTEASIGYISAASAASMVSWVLADAQGALSSAKQFGKGSNRIVSGADFNGDGLVDAAVVADGSSSALFRWHIQPDFLAPAPARAAALKHQNRRARHHRRVTGKAAGLLSVRFGRHGDTAFFLNPDGAGDSLALLRKDNATGIYRLLLRSPYAKVARKVIIGPLSGTQSPLPVQQADGKDLLAVYTRSGGNTPVKFFSMTGEELADFTMTGTGTVIVGNFNELPGQEIAIQTASGFTIYNPNAPTDVRTVTLASGIPVDDVNITTFGFSPGGGNSGGGGNNGGGNSGGGSGGGACGASGSAPSGGLESVCSVVYPMNTCVLYKPGSGGTADARTGRPAFLWYSPADNPGVDHLDVYASNGTKIAQFGFYFPAPAPLARFYSGYDPGTGETGSQLMAAANAASGKPWLYFFTKNGKCWGPVTNANGRSGGR